MRKLVLAALIGTIAACATPSADAPEQGSAMDAAQNHPLAGYLAHPKKAALIRLEKKWADASGYPLYVLDRECNAQCAVLFPPLTPIVGDTSPNADWTIRVREENGDMQWVYKGRPVYVYSGDYVERPEMPLPDGTTKPASKAQPPRAHQIVPWVHLAKP
jgi:predicted lipoprotein with Yx(FWY)xxD motif